MSQKIINKKLPNCEECDYRKQDKSGLVWKDKRMCEPCYAQYDAERLGLEDDDEDDDEDDGSTEYARKKPCECGCGLLGGTCEEQTKKYEEENDATANIYEEPDECDHVKKGYIYCPKCSK